jgi:hydrogenase nickel incorporation protein HypA/HybF
MDAFSPAGIYLSGRSVGYRFCHLARETAAFSIVFGGIMHELSIMQSALNQALDQARQAGAVRVHEIRLRIGVLSGVVPEALQFAFEALSDGTPAEGGRLTIEHVPARFWCATCNREFEAIRLFTECPECHNPSGELRSGRELELASLEVD